MKRNTGQGPDTGREGARGGREGGKEGGRKGGSSCRVACLGAKDGVRGLVWCEGGEGMGGVITE